MSGMFPYSIPIPGKSLEAKLLFSASKECFTGSAFGFPLSGSVSAFSL
jgi:hypothetical protein